MNIKFVLCLFSLATSRTFAGDIVLQFAPHTFERSIVPAPDNAPLALVRIRSIPFEDELLLDRAFEKEGLQTAQALGFRRVSRWSRDFMIPVVADTSICPSLKKANPFQGVVFELAPALRNLVMTCTGTPGMEISRLFPGEEPFNHTYESMYLIVQKSLIRDVSALCGDQ